MLNITFAEDEYEGPVGELDISGKDLYWLAGVLEGEGSFHAKQHVPTDRSPGGRCHCQVKIAMTDRDIISRVAGLFGTKTHGPYKNGNKCKDIYTAVLSKRSKVGHLCQLLYPLMGERRRKQLLGVIKFISEWGPVTKQVLFRGPDGKFCRETT